MSANSLIERFRQVRLLIVGDVMVDRYWSGSVTRISPEAPVPIVRIEQCEDRPGGAANVAVNAAALGAQVHLLGVTGLDEAATRLQTQVTAYGITSDLLAQANAQTIVKLRVMSRHQQLVRLDFENGLVFPEEKLLSLFAERLPFYDAVILSDYHKGTLRSVANYIALARKAGKPTFVDPKQPDSTVYRGATVLTPNVAELERWVGRCPDQATVIACGEQLRQRLELHALLVTQGERGMTLLQQDAPPLHLPAQAREVYDVTGAGDTVLAVLAVAVTAGDPFQTAAQWANGAASIVVGKLGTASVTGAELAGSIASKNHSTTAEPTTTAAVPNHCIVTEAQLMAYVAQARWHGETLVMTNGCFDLLHAGHVAYLTQAKQLGHRLIVAVNDDRSVKRLKGADRPILPLLQRMTLLAALTVVDWVVAFSEDTPERLINRVKPDYLVKGGDYSDPKAIAGYDCVTASGGQVKILNYYPSDSTTTIVQRIRQLPTHS